MDSLCETFSILVHMDGQWTINQKKIAEQWVRWVCVCRRAVRL